MFQQRDIITAVEIGTSKVCVLVGEAEKNEKISIIGFGERPSNGAVCKGEINDMDGILAVLAEVIEEADKSSGHEIGRSSIYVAVTGSDIGTYQGAGTVFINNPERRVSEDEIEEAVENAQIKFLKSDQVVLGSFDSYYLLDGARRVFNPIDQVAGKLEAFIHVIYGDANRIENFRTAVYDAGFDQEITPVFSGLGSAYGVLSDEEKEHGVLLVDMGAGTTEYIVIYNYGILMSGVLPIGFEHVANDLSLGLDLHIGSCRKLLMDDIIIEHRRAGKGFIEIPGASGGKRIPLASIEKIIDLRLRETFGIVHRKVQDQGVVHNLGSGAVFSGGAALFEPAVEIFSRIFDIPIRRGQPFDRGRRGDRTGKSALQHGMGDIEIRRI